MTASTQEPISIRPPKEVSRDEAIARTVDIATRAFEEGRTRPLAWRREQLGKLAEFIKGEESAIEAALTEDLGRHPFETYVAELWPLLLEIADARKHLAAWAAPRRVPTPLTLQPASATVRPEPLGVALIIAPWNIPMNLTLAPLIGAMAAGNCAVLKPSELAPSTSRLLAEKLPRYLDPECFPVVEGAVPETTALLEQRFDHIFYTGGGRVARIVLTAAAKHLTPTTLELGGKSPCIVDDSAKLRVAARRIAWGKCLNAGQVCVSPDYVLVSEDKHDALVDALKSALVEFYGTDPQSSPYYGRIINEGHFDRLTALIDRHKVVHGGESDRADKYIAPTLMTEVTPDDAIMQEEIFGPILPILKVRDTNEAIEYVARRDKPLALYLFAEDRRVQEQVLSRTSAGGVTLNHTVFHLAHGGLPFGGVGPSGMGSYHGKWGFDTFSHLKPVFKKATWIDPPFTYPPYSDWKRSAMGMFV
ncbi:MAG: aldehyde dehydrogenase family protein [Myxococcota bacterium]